MPRKPVFPRRRKAKAVRTAKPTKSQVVTIVKKMIDRNVENKFVGYQVETNVLHNSGITSGDCLPILGTVVSGTTPTRRIGDRISPKSLTVKGVLSWTPAGCNTSQNMYVRVIIASQKTIKLGSQVVAGAVDAAHLVRTGIDGFDQTNFDGTTRSLNYLMNKDSFHVYYDRIHMLAPNNVGGGGCESMPLYSKRWSYTFKSLPSHLAFDTQNGDWPINFAPFLAIGYAYPDGTAPDVVTTKLITNTNSYLSFEDA